MQTRGCEGTLHGQIELIAPLFIRFTKMLSIGWIRFSAAVIYFLTTSGTTDGKDVNLAVLIPMTGANPIGSTTAGAIHVAIDEINNNHTFLPGRTLTFLHNDTHCNARDGLAEAVNLWVTMRRDLHAFIGGACDIVCEPAGLLAAEWNVPMITYGCSSSVLNNKADYPTVARTVAPYSKISPMIVAIMNYYKWNRIGILTSSENVWQQASHSFKLEIESQGKLVAEFHSFDPGHVHISGRAKARHKDILKDMKKKSRILVLCAYGGDIREIMLNALDLGMITGKYAFITIDLLRGSQIGINTWMGDDGRDQEATYAFNGILNIHLHKPDTLQYAEFESKVRLRSKDPPFNLDIPKNEEIDVHAGMIYDAIYLYAHALRAVLNEKHDEYDGALVAKKLFNMEFDGIMGKVHIDQYGNRDPDYALQDLKDNTFEDFARYHAINKVFTVRKNVKVIFPGGSTIPPKDHPECGWNNEFCPDNTSAVIWSVFGSLLGLLLIGIPSGMLYYRKWKYEADLNSVQSWRVQYDEIVLMSGIGSSSRFSLGTQSTNKSRSFKSECSGIDSESLGGTQVFAKVGKYKGKLVAIKYVNKKYIEMKRHTLIEVKQVRDLQHENINQFVGACTEAPNICLLTIYCTKGSLQDVIENDDIRLDEDFKMSFMTDIFKGMEYLHTSSIGSHGRLKSSNCVIDRRWVCKITDYGMGIFKSEQETSAEEAGPRYKDKLWTAPELLRMPKPPVYGTQKGDVFSFAIILQEIILRGGPYCTETKMEPRAIVALVKEGIDPPCRPDVPRHACKEDVYLLMRDCWEELPENRPDFNIVGKRMKKINGGKRMNVVDKMITMMEQHADHLEATVSERTQELEKEKRKTDQLLEMMLPKSVAEALKTGQQVAPEAYDSVTVAFSDIVGFTKLSSESSPIQVVNLLNDLYTCFDTIIDAYDVYKVETIGDAYMVVSGLPQKNGDNHAGEIATMALDLMASLVHFRIRHRPGEQLQLRLGMHTGPVVAGVVGNKMPRFCLFGDTVNTASRMESTSFALRIHLSDTTKYLLDLLGGYTTEKRGEVEAKGKGKITTYWLKGKEGFDKVLPDLSLATPEDQHEFK